jgi:hypothetical protein
VLGSQRGTAHCRGVGQGQAGVSTTGLGMQGVAGLIMFILCFLSLLSA